MSAAIDYPGVLPALQAIRSEAHRRESLRPYQMASVRSIATDLGYAHLLPIILRACVEGGFDYCLDEDIECSDGIDGRTFPNRDVCVWGCDQLRSRLDCVDYRLYSKEI